MLNMKIVTVPKERGGKGSGEPLGFVNTFGKRPTLYRFLTKFYMSKLP